MYKVLVFLAGINLVGFLISMGTIVYTMPNAVAKWKVGDTLCTSTNPELESWEQNQQPSIKITAVGKHKYRYRHIPPAHIEYHADPASFIYHMDAPFSYVNDFYELCDEDYRRKHEIN